MARPQSQEPEAPGSGSHVDQQPNSNSTQVEEPDVASRPEIRTSDREELIQCIKRGHRPTWVPKPSLEALCAEVSAEEVLRASREAENRDEKKTERQNLNDPTPSNPVARPPSAFHAGDFRESLKGGGHFIHLGRKSSKPTDAFQEHNVSPPAWVSRSPFAHLERAASDFTTIQTSPPSNFQRPRAPSLGSSLSSNFVMRVPTSPLIHATNNPSLDFSPRDLSSNQGAAGDKAHRRRTMPPHSLAGLQMSPLDSSLSGPSRPWNPIRREVTMPHQIHQPRRSLNSFTYQPGSSPQTPLPPRTRRLSHAADISPRQRTSMVGSFEESILRGRMSMAPSKPLDFVAEIGVLGKGSCPASLKCPAHVSVPFPAVFYSYPSANGPRTISDDSPSPYVGTIDLEHHLKPADEPHKRQRNQDLNDPEALVAEITGPEHTSIGKALAREESEKRKKAPLKAPAGGSYRVPQQGQLQIIIKNPNKTAVKLFLIPYDLGGMPPGSKTFVRQRSYSSGPVVESMLSDKTEALPIADPLSDKCILRYLIHLKFCCPSKGRFYLYDNIRVVFANRVPEGKEKLRNDVQLPEPMFSPYDASQRSSRSKSRSSSLALDSLGRGMSPQDRAMESNVKEGRRESDGIHFASVPIPFHLAPKRSQFTEMDGSNGENYGERDVVPGVLCRPRSAASNCERPQSPVAGFEMSSTSSRGSPVPWGQPVGSSSPRSFSPVPAEAGGGLLSRKLRELNKQKSQNGSSVSETDSKVRDLQD